MTGFPEALAEYKNEFFTPTYRPFDGERWSLRLADMILCRGYWSEASLIRGMAALIRKDGDQKRTWMSMTPMEIESQELGCRYAVGHVAVMGAGMGWAFVNAALNPDVHKVTVVEYDPEVIELIRSLGIIEQLPAEAAARITLIQGDAYNFIPDTPADTLLADIWLPLFGPERDEEVRRMRANTDAEKVYFWGQEMVIADRARRKGMPLNAQSTAEIVAEMDLPLIGPNECPDYPQMIERAAKAWLRG